MTAYSRAEVTRLIEKARRQYRRPALPLAMADQLEAARAEVERYRAQAKRIDEGERRVLAEYDELVAELAAARAEGEQLRAQVAALQAANVELRRSGDEWRASPSWSRAVRDCHRCMHHHSRYSRHPVQVAAVSHGCDAVNEVA